MLFRADCDLSPSPPPQGGACVKILSKNEAHLFVKRDTFFYNPLLKMVLGFKKTSMR